MCVMASFFFRFIYLGNRITERGRCTHTERTKVRVRERDLPFTGHSPYSHASLDYTRQIAVARTPSLYPAWVAENQDLGPIPLPS